MYEYAGPRLRHPPDIDTQTKTKQLHCVYDIQPVLMPHKCLSTWTTIRYSHTQVHLLCSSPSGVLNLEAASALKRACPYWGLPLPWNSRARASVPSPTFICPPYPNQALFLSFPSALWSCNYLLGALTAVCVMQLVPFDQTLPWADASLYVTQGPPGKCVSPGPPPRA
jgi:hypothetical protein